MKLELVEEFITAFHAEVNAKAATNLAERDAPERQLVRVKKQIETIIDSIADGFRTEGMKGRLEELEGRRVSLERQIAQPRPTTIRLHPALPELYKEKVKRLADSLNDPAIRDEAITLLRELIESVTVTRLRMGGRWK